MTRPDFSPRNTLIHIMVETTPGKVFPAATLKDISPVTPRDVDYQFPYLFEYQVEKTFNKIVQRGFVFDPDHAGHFIRFNRIWVEVEMTRNDIPEHSYSFDLG